MKGVKPYIGVTGVVTPKEAKALGDIARAAWIDGTHELMIGLLVSSKTMAGQTVPNKRYPDIKDLREIVSTCAGYSFTTVHYNTQKREDLAGQLAAVLKQAPGIDGFQLNIRNPDIREIGQIKTENPELRIILQVNFSSLVALENEPTPEAACKYVRQYAGVADYALLDLSGGRGTLIDTAWAKEAVERIQSDSEASQVKIGLAGALGAGSEAKQKLGELAEALGRGFSIDAESKVRKPAANSLPNERFQDDLDLDKVAEYLKTARQILVEGIKPSKGAIRV